MVAVMLVTSVASYCVFGRGMVFPIARLRPRYLIFHATVWADPFGAVRAVPGWWQRCCWWFRIGS